MDPLTIECMFISTTCTLEHHETLIASVWCAVHSLCVRVRMRVRVCVCVCVKQMKSCLCLLYIETFFTYDK